MDETLFMVWTGTDYTPWFTTFDGAAWQPQQKNLAWIAGALSRFLGLMNGAMAVYGNRLYLAQPGGVLLGAVPPGQPTPQDPHPMRKYYAEAFVFWTTFYPANGAWLPVAGAIDLNTEHRPALAPFQDRLFIAAKGPVDDKNIWWANFDGIAWSPPASNTGVGTSNGPALAAFRGSDDAEALLVMAWRGADDDQTVYWSTFDGAVWAPQRAVPGAGTSNDPALAVFRERLYLIWNGGARDSKIYWSTLDSLGGDWSPLQELPEAGTNDSLAAAVFQGSLFVAWKGVGDDNIWWSHFDGAGWSPQERNSNFSALHGPSLASFHPTLLHELRRELMLRLWLTRWVSMRR